jgi:hypothetical protein
MAPLYRTHRFICAFFILIQNARVSSFHLSSNGIRGKTGIRAKTQPAALVTFQAFLCRSRHLGMLPKLIQGLLDVSVPASTGSVASTDNSNHMLFGAFPSTLLFNGFPSMALGLTGTTAVAAGSVLFQDSDAVAVEAQLLNDMSHLGIDLAGFFIPSLLALRVAAIAGRVCTMAADYIPDHTIVPEEFLFQISMLTIGCLGLMKAALIPAAAAAYSNRSVSIRDGRAYIMLFQPAGTSWSQYKALSVCRVLDWVTLQSGDTVTTDALPPSSGNDDYIYWLYSGDVLVHNNEGDLLYSVSRSKKDTQYQKAGRDLFGEHRLLELFRKKKVNGSKQRPSSYHQDKNSKYASNVVVVTSNEATMLRIHVPRLKWLMDHDPSLAESARTLVFQGMEAKLQAQVQETTTLLKYMNVTAIADSA